LGRSRGGLTTKIHLLADELGLPLGFVLTGGQTHDCTQALTLLSERVPEAVLADKGYDTEEGLLPSDGLSGMLSSNSLNVGFL
jgi:hypothetical protein